MSYIGYVKWCLRFLFNKRDVFLALWLRSFLGTCGKSLLKAEKTKRASVRAPGIKRMRFQNFALLLALAVAGEEQGIHKS